VCVFAVEESYRHFLLSLPCVVEDRSALVLAAIGKDTIVLWDVEEGKCLREWKGEEKDGKKVFCGVGFIFLDLDYPVAHTRNG